MEEAVKEAPSSDDAGRALLEYTIEVPPISPMIDDDAEERSTVNDTTEKQPMMVIDAIKVEKPALFVATTMIAESIEISDDEEEDSARIQQVIHVTGVEDGPPGATRRLDSEEMIQDSDDASRMVNNDNRDKPPITPTICVSDTEEDVETKERQGKHHSLSTSACSCYSIWNKCTLFSIHTEIRKGYTY